MSIQRLDRQMISKLQEALKEFLTDHELTVTLFDFTVDSSGLLLLICPYRYQRTYWFLVIILELYIYAIICGILNYYGTFVSRIIVCEFINFMFFVVTYFSQPYSLRQDIILDSCGRILVCFVGIILLICQNIQQPVTPNGAHIQHNNIPLYDPPKAYSFFFSLDYSKSVTYLVLDAFIVIYMYVYIFYIIQQLGLFSYLQKKVRNIKYGMHDHILNFLMKKIRLTTLGFENIYIGQRFFHLFFAFFHLYFLTLFSVFFSFIFLFFYLYHPFPFSLLFSYS